MDFDFAEVSFDADFTADLDFDVKVPPPVDADLEDQSLYPEELRSPLFLDLSPHEEGLQSAALAWFLQWRKTNPFRIEGSSGIWIRPPEDLVLWSALEERIIDWAFLEKGGLDLEATHTMLLKRHRIRLAVTPIRPITTPPAGAGPLRKETPDVRKPQQNSSAKRDSSRNAASLRARGQYHQSGEAIPLHGFNHEEATP